jgi:hypothetical protein
MKAQPVIVTLAVCFSALSTRQLSAQAPCATTATVVDSARDEVTSVLGSESQLVAELRQEQGLPKTGAISPVTVVKDRFVCSRLAALFDHDVAPGVSFVVLRVGPLYYAREPDQRKGTGIISDSTFHVVMRLGVPVASRSPTGASTR